MGVTEQLIMFVLEQFTFTTPVLFFTILFFIYITKYVLYLRTLPPGPTGIPIFGSLLSFKKPFHLEMYDFAQQYGKLMSVRMGSQLVVVINDVNLLKKAFSQHEFTARPKSVLDSICQGYGLITSDGALWKSQRSFIHKHKFGLKFWGNIGDQMEQRVSHEVLCCLTAIHNGSKYSEDMGTTNLGIDPSAYLSCSISNVICSIIMSTRFKHGEERFRQFIQFFDEGFRLFKLTGVMIFLPFVKMFPAMSEVCNKLKKNREELLNFVAEIIEEHKRSLDSKSPRDLVDAYLLEIEKTRENGTTEEVFQSKEPEVQLQQVLVDLFSAGFETVKTTLLWTIIHMLRNPEIKRKVQEELERVVGGNRLPCLDDMSRLNYSRACIYESMRRSLAVPLGTTHSNNRPVSLEGHTIPENSHVIPNLYAIHMDPETWENPEEYNPERFLDSEGNLVKPKQFIPFGTGQRMCLGDKLAETELQLFFTSILHVFDIESIGDAPSLDGNLGATLTPTQFNVKFVERNLDALISANTKAKPTYSQFMRTYG